MALSKINPTKLSSWKKLVQQFDKENNLHINDFFKEENNRLDKFCISWENFYVDFSKNRLSNNSFKLLTDLCKETNLKNNIKKYFNGSIINETENTTNIISNLNKPITIVPIKVSKEMFETKILNKMFLLNENIFLITTKKYDQISTISKIIISDIYLK